MPQGLTGDKSTLIQLIASAKVELDPCHHIAYQATMYQTKLYRVEKSVPER